jgi:hypothetical protein
MGSAKCLDEENRLQTGRLAVMRSERSLRIAAKRTTRSFPNAPMLPIYRRLRCVSFFIATR